jgi:hypothetical protein
MLDTLRQHLLGAADSKLKEQLSEPVSVPKLVALGGVPCANQVPQRLLLDIRDPNRREIPAAKQARKLLRIAPTGLHPVPRLDRDERRRHDLH